MIWSALLILPVLAGDASEPRLFAQASDATVKIKVEAMGVPGLGEDLPLFRIRGRVETPLHAGYADYETRTCKVWEVDDSWWGRDTGRGWTCEDYPDRCEDCDGDGQMECQWGCVTWYGWDLEDSCVKPGAVKYEVRHPESLWGAASVDVIVEDVGQNCRYEIRDKTRAALPGEGGEGFMGCSTAQSLSLPVRVLLGLILLMTGWLAFRSY